MSSVIVVKKRMRDLNITQRQLAQYIMQPEHVIHDWLLGKSVLSYHFVFKICDLLSIDPFDLFQKNFTRRMVRK